MLTNDEAREFAGHWISAWNAHDLAAILSHYSNEVVLTSPVAARILNDPAGRITGKDALRAYFPAGGCPERTIERRAVLRESCEHQDRGVHGIRRERESSSGHRELQFLI